MKTILLILRRDIGYDRAIMRGAIALARRRPDWRLHVVPYDAHAEAAIKRFEPAGVIGRLILPGLLATIRRADIPAVVVSNARRIRNLPRIGLDEAKIGMLAARYLLQKGFRCFGFVPNAELSCFSDEREKAFRCALESAAAGCVTMPHPESLGVWQSLAIHVDWIAGLPKPVALFAANDATGAAVLEVCRLAGVRVPDEVAVLGVDNDELFCSVAPWPLSSIAVPAFRVGWESARMLSRLLDGEEAGGLPWLLPPARVVSRYSTEVLTVSDPHVAGAMRFIRDHSHEPIDVADVLGHVAASRRKLEQAFRKALGSTILTQIHQARIGRAEELLLTSDLSMEEVAESCGLSGREQLSRLFRKITGQTPAAYRRLHRRER